MCLGSKSVSQTQASTLEPIEDAPATKATVVVLTTKALSRAFESCLQTFSQPRASCSGVLFALPEADAKPRACAASRGFTCAIINVILC